MVIVMNDAGSVVMGGCMSDGGGEEGCREVHGRVELRAKVGGACCECSI